MPSYEIRRVAITSVGKVTPPAVTAAGAGALRRPLNPGAARRPVTPAGNAADLAAPPSRPGARFSDANAEMTIDTFVDPVTGESMKDDHQLTLLVAAVLDPKPPAPPAEGQTPAAE
jgi:hypothetical protein